MHESLIIPSCTHIYVYAHDFRGYDETEIQREREREKERGEYERVCIRILSILSRSPSQGDLSVCAPPILNVCRQFQRNRCPAIPFSSYYDPLRC